MTPAYAAPEQVLGGRLGIHTDIYALGVLLFELLTERLPAERRPGLRLKDASPRERPSHATSRQLRARSASRASWADLDVLCMNAMHEDPERRYPTVEALVRDIDHYLAHQPLEARPDALGYRLGKFLARNRAAVLVAGAAFVFALGLAVFYTARLAAARDAAQVEAARAQRIQAFMLDLFEGGDDAAGPAEDLRVLSLLERGVEEASALGEEPEVQAELERTLGGLFQKLGKFERAEALLAGALRQQRELHGEGAPSTADTSVVLGLLRLEQARFEEAEELVRDGLGALRARLPAEHPSVVRATSALGQVLEARGDYDGAIAINEEVARLYAASGDGGAEHTAALGQLADSHYYAGHYELADAINERVLAAVRAIHGEGHPRVADVMINLGASQSDRGRYPEAEAFYRQALDILEAFHGADHFRTASAKTMLGRTLVYQGRTAEGIPLLQDALAIQEAVHGSEHPRVASALNDLGSAALQEGRLDEAEECFLRMLEVYRHVYPEGHYLEGIAISNLGSVMVERADHVAAEHLYREALAIYESRLSPAHLNTGIGRIKLGRALLRQSRFAEAEVESRAGYEIVQAQSSPSVSWLRSARADLVAAYEALGEPERAQAFREAEQP